MKQPASSNDGLCQFAVEKVAYGIGNFVNVRLKRKMTGFEEVDFCARVIALEGLSTWRQKKRIVLSPDGKQRRATGSEIFLKLGIENDIARVVEDLPATRVLRRRLEVLIDRFVRD